ncbi:MAG: phage portal protein [Gammaproteobacteria bacterium]|nr:MAG: phage portal protein [Gammaproteobacteria bacterium]
MGFFGIGKKVAEPEKAEERSAGNSSASVAGISRPPRLKKRAYAAAETGNLTHSWATVSRTSDQVIFQNLRILRARSRDQYEGNDFARRFVEMVKTHVVGSDGFVLQAQIVGRDGKPDEAANKAVEQNQKEWARAKYSHAAGQLHFNDLTRLIVGSLPVDGEVIIRRRLGPKFGRYQYALQLIDPELLDVTYNIDLKSGRQIRFGIEYDEDDRPQAYYFKKSSSQFYTSGSSTDDYTRVPANEITHLYVVERVGQRRGIPWLATPLLRMQMLDGYSEAALIAARVGASKAVYYKSDPEADASMAGVATLEEDGLLIDEVDPGSANLLPPGVDIAAYDPTYPNNDFEPFVKAQLRSIAAGLGVSYHKLANDLTDVNYASGRLGELEDREIWKRLQQWIIESFLRPLYEDWLAMQLKLGTLTVQTAEGGRPLKGDPEKYEKVRFQGRRWQWTDPLKEANGNRINLENYLTSPQRVLRESGFDPDEILNEWDQWLAKLKELGLAVPQNQPQTEADDDTENEDEND